MIRRNETTGGNMSTVIEWLQGKKSYIVLVLAFVFNFGQLMGWWGADNQVWAAIDTLFATLLGFTFRAAIAKSGPVK
jgi:hypothetical protein